jgi:hypothetical protein
MAPERIAARQPGCHSFYWINRESGVTHSGDDTLGPLRVICVETTFGASPLLLESG